MKAVWLYEKEGADWLDPDELLLEIERALRNRARCLENPGESLRSLLANLQIHHGGWEGKLLREGVELGREYLGYPELFALLRNCDTRAFEGEYAEAMWLTALGRDYPDVVFEQLDILCGRPETLSCAPFDWYVRHCARWCEYRLWRFQIKLDGPEPIEPKFITSLLAAVDTPLYEAPRGVRAYEGWDMELPPMYALRDCNIYTNIIEGDHHMRIFFLRWILLELTDDWMRRIYFGEEWSNFTITSANRAWFKWRVATKELVRFWTHAAKWWSGIPEVFEKIEAIISKVAPGCQEDPAFRKYLENALFDVFALDEVDAANVVASATRLLGTKPPVQPMLRAVPMLRANTPLTPDCPRIAAALRA